jgi:hypothetical protein
MMDPREHARSNIFKNLHQLIARWREIIIPAPGFKFGQVMIKVRTRISRWIAIIPGCRDVSE